MAHAARDACYPSPRPVSPGLRFSMRAKRSGPAVALAALLALTTSGPARAQDKGEDERDRPHDLILAVDVSLSMIMETVEGQRRLPPNDREGIRWDGLRFTIDVARDDDRIALVLYRAENVILTRHLDDSG